MKPLAERLGARAQARPDAEAIVHAGARHSYAAVWSAVQAFARFLDELRVGRGDRVAILAGNGLHYIAAYYGTLWVGGVAVPLNPAARAVELTNLLRHCRARVLVIDGSLYEVAPLCKDLPPELVLVDVSRTADRVEPTSMMAWADIVNACANIPVPPRLRDSSDLATILYTSGTTGRPKGVMLSHGNLCANVDAILAFLPITNASRSVHVLPFHYSYGNSILHTHMSVGACLVLEDNLLYPHRVVERIASECADGFAGVPSTYALLLERISLTEYDLSSLVYITQAGGAMHADLIRRVRSALPHAQLFVMYGQTEATARICILPPARLVDKPGSCGIAVPGTTVQVRRADGCVALAGEEGELYVRGSSVMLGYWEDEAATRDVLCDGWLRTGDLARQDSEGFVFLLGRRGDMIKTGAHRVHPQEVEEAITSMPQVKDVAVVGVDDALLGQAIKAIIVLRDGATCDAMEVKAQCRASLPLYKVPKHIEFALALPRTASGKVRRFLLTRAGAES